MPPARPPIIQPMTRFRTLRQITSSASQTTCGSLVNTGSFAVTLVGGSRSQHCCPARPLSLFLWTHPTTYRFAATSPARGAPSTGNLCRPAAKTSAQFAKFLEDALGLLAEHSAD